MTFIVPAGSVLAMTAAEVLERHEAAPGGLCKSCGWPAPCVTANHARLVVSATAKAAEPERLLPAAA